MLPLDEATRYALDAGIKVLQGSRLAPTDDAHVSRLLAYMDPPLGAVLLDAGCGFGEVARLMRCERPDLDFILLNENALQLSHAPSMRRVQADMHALPLADASVDGVMFCYSLCHTDISVALTEAARVTRPGGFLFVYDYDRLRGDSNLMHARLFAWAIPFDLMVWAAERAGWLPVMHENPHGDDTMFRAAYANDAEYNQIFDDLALSVWKMRRA
jgi:SAM-dependent methyltransferase